MGQGAFLCPRSGGGRFIEILVYACFYAMSLGKAPAIAGVFLGIAAHWRLYPACYALPLLLGLRDQARPGLLGLLTRRVIIFSIASGLTFVTLGTFFFGLYGWDFLDGAYLYHGRRLDPHHNFSVYFYPIALHSEDPSRFPNLARLAFLPQLILCVWFGWDTSDSAIAVGPLLQTLSLVATNKVLTAQYFVWWWALLPLALPWLAWRRRGLWLSLLLWAVAEVHWLLWAYLLEFRGWPVRPGVWGASCIFLLAHMNIMVELRRSRTEWCCQKHINAGAAEKKKS